SEISLYVLSAEPLASPVIFDRKLKVYKSEKEKGLENRVGRKESRADMRARIFHGSPLEARMKGEDPNDPPPPYVFDPPGLSASEREFYEDVEEDFYSSGLQLLRSMSVQ